MHLSLKAGVARGLATLASAVIPLVLLAPVAHADDATKKSPPAAGSTCTNELVKSGSSKARVSVSGYSYVDADSSVAKLSTSQVSGRVTSCTGTSDNGVATSKITVRMLWIVTSTGLGSCSFGLPSGVSCTIDAKETIIKRTWTCTNVSSCTKTSASEIRPKPRQGYKILNVTYEVSATAQQSGKDSVTAETDSVTWWA